VDHLDYHERLATHRLRDLVDRREVEKPPDSGELIRQIRRRQRVPRLENLVSPRDRIPQHPGIHLLDREQLQLDRGHDAEAATAATQRPEQVRLVLAIDPAQPSVGRD
jgi:hypothetical protein